MSSSNPTSTEERGGAEEASEGASESLEESLEALMTEAREAAASASIPSALPHAAVPVEMVTTELQLPIPPEAVRPPDELAPPVVDPAALAEGTLSVELSTEQVDAQMVAAAEPAIAEATEPPLTGAVAAPLVSAEEAPWTADAPPPEEEVEADGLVEEIASPSRSELEAITKEAVRSELAPPAFPDDDEGDEDRTVLSPMPIEADPPSPSLDLLAARAPVPRPVLPEQTEPVRVSLGRLPVAPRPRIADAVESIKRVAGHRVNASVAQLAIVVLASSVVGASAVRLFGHRGGEATAQATPARLLDGPSEVAPPRLPEIAPLPAVVEGAPAVPQAEPEPLKQKTALRPKLRLPHPATTTVATTAPDRPADSSAEGVAAPRPVPLKKPAVKARTRHVAQQGTWVDPFGD
jgi:hypothetical protein